MEVQASQAQAFRMCKARAERTDYAPSKTLSRLPAQPAAFDLPHSIAADPAGMPKWWAAEGPHCANLFKWSAIQARAAASE